MERTKVFRRLRIAWSVFWGIVCVLLAVLWVRSYWWTESLIGPISRSASFQLISTNGQLDISGPWRFDTVPSWRYRSSKKHEPTFCFATPGGTFGFLAYYERPIRGQWIPYYFMVALTAMLSALPLAPLNFSLRTLLIATTAIAVLLGLTVWTLRN